MAKKTVATTGLFRRKPPEPGRPPIELIGSLPEVLRAFQQVTGWSLRYLPGPPPCSTSGPFWSAPVNPGVGATLGHLRLEPMSSIPAAPPRVGRRPAEGGRTPVSPQRSTSAHKGDAPPVASRDAPGALQAERPKHRGPSPASPGGLPMDFGSARALAEAISGLLIELLENRHALWQREAELAAGVPLVPHPKEQQHLAARLEAVLRGGAEAIGGQAAALYLLDEATTQLKLRSCWGLPFDRFASPARPLDGAAGDLEALIGHAVVLTDPELMRRWKVPEDFAAAACVPVSTPTTLLGTLWVFCASQRDFSDAQTNILEIVAGRLAADLEREMLLREGLQSVQLKRQLAAAERLQLNQLPTISPLLDGWELAGWTAQAEGIGGDFYDWFCLPDGLLAVAVGDAFDRGIPGAITAGVVRGLLRGHVPYHRQAEHALTKINLSLWIGGAGDQHFTLFLGLIETATGRLSSATAGDVSLVRLGSSGWDSLTHACPRLGEGPETDYEQFGLELQPGQTLIAFTPGVRDALDGHGQPLGEAGLVRPLLARTDLGANALLSLARQQYLAHAAEPRRNDCTMLVIRRTVA